MSDVRIRGAGDYEAERDHCDASREFAEAGEVQKSPQDADPAHPQLPEAADDDAGRIAAGGRVADDGHPPLETSPTTIAQPPKGN